MVVFVSYQRADTLFAAHAIGYAIRGAGHEAFVDTGSIGGGDLYPQVISKAVSNANVMLSLIGPSFDCARLFEANSVVAYEWRRAQFHGTGVVPVLVDGGRIPSDAELPAELRWFTKRNAYSLRRESFSDDVSALVYAIPVLAAIPRRAARVLWVDDRPSNNEFERKTLRPHGIVFDNVVSTAEAVEQLANENYDLVITDLGRADSSDRSQTAGASFLKHPAVIRGGPPVIVYASQWAVRQKDELLQLGASEVTASRQQLIDIVLGILGRVPERSSNLSR
jgi:CheY-like chemotaxis protein